MKRHKTQLLHLLQTFHRTTGIGAFCLDRNLSIVARSTSIDEYYTMPMLGIGQIVDFVSKAYEEGRTANGAFDTYIMECNLISNIIFIRCDDGCVGTLVTEPVLIKKIRLEEIDNLIEQYRLDAANRKALIDFLMKIPVVPYERVMPLGETLYCMSRSVGSPDNIRQVLRRNEEEPGLVARPQAAFSNADFDDHGASRHSPFETYQKIQEAIRNGDVAGLERVMAGINAGSIPMDQLNRADFVRSVKDSFIKSCAMACFAAIEANAPFTQVMDMSDEFIRGMEQLSNIYDIYDLMKAAVISFARAVAINRALYSKPVRQTIDYIKSHYAEKITLGLLAEHTNLSTFYLSNLIKKETGLSLADNINKIRIAESKRLLRDKSLSILDVALHVGFAYQNHFASVFRKFANCSPSEFRELLLQPDKSAENNRSPGEYLPIITNQVDSVLSVFPQIYDIVRVVDPVNHTAWVIRTGSGLFDHPPETCYAFWSRNKSCENCISERAYMLNDAIYKLDCMAECTFLVLAAPKRIGNRRYVVEFLKDVSKSIVIKEDNRQTAAT
jgi:AraC-like DNA-binding protein